MTRSIDLQVGRYSSPPTVAKTSPESDKSIRNSLNIVSGAERVEGVKECGCWVLGTGCWVLEGDEQVAGCQPKFPRIFIVH